MTKLPQVMIDVMNRLEAQAAEVQTTGEPTLPEHLPRLEGEGWHELLTRRKEAVGGSPSGHCVDALRAEAFAGRIVLEEDQAAHWHAECRGAYTNGAGKTTLCTCPCHDHNPKCSECGNQDPRIEGNGYDPVTRRCTDRTACATRIAERLREIRLAHPSAMDKHFVAKAPKAVDAGEVAPKPHGDVPAHKSRPSRSKGTPQRCHCGCGGETKGGRFCMGHDMKLKGRLFEVARGSTNASDPEGQRHAVDEIVARGWNEAGCLQPMLDEARTKDPTEVIKQAVFARYDGIEGDIA